MLKNLANILTYMLTGIGALILIWWLFTNPTRDLAASIPGSDNRVSETGAAEEQITIGEQFERFETRPHTSKEQWPRFRGSDFDNISKTPLKLIDEFGPGGPEILWSVGLGEGHAGPAVYDGAVYLLDYDEEKRADMLKCYALENGTELWRRWYHVNVKRNHGMSRTIPAVTEDYILTIGPRSHVMCVERSSGNFLWGIDVEKEYLTEIPFWYTGQCPLIVNGLAIIATGGRALMIAVDCATGRILWETPNEQGWKMSHSSVMPFTFRNRKMYVYSAVGGACGVSAEGDDAGKLLWSTSAWNHPVVAPSPVCMPDGKIFLTAGYGAGSMMLQLHEQGGRFDVEVLQEYQPREGLACEQQTPVYFMDHLFGILPKDASALRNQFACVHPSDCRTIVWSSGQEYRFGLGPYLYADGKFYLLNDDGMLSIIGASTRAFMQLDQARIFEGHDAWAPLALVDGYLLLRDSKNLFCIDIRS